MNLLIARCRTDGHLTDVRIRDGRVTEVAERLRPARDEDLVDARGGALLPGLHDHHAHLLAMGAAERSVVCGPPAVNDAAALRAVLRGAADAVPAGGWVRGTGYSESVAGLLDRTALDGMVADRPVRLQHRGGALWILNSAGLAAVASALDDSLDVERDAAGHPTGRLWRYDVRLRAAIGAEPPDLASVGERLASYGITGVTDATPDLDAAGLELIGTAVLGGRLRQGVQLLGAATGTPLAPGLSSGPYKILLRDHDLPGLEELAGLIDRSHRAARPVAVHCVTRESLLLTLAALEIVGTCEGDRVEHAAVVPPEMCEHLAAKRLTVVTQPSFIATRGDTYLASVDPRDAEHLYPYATLLAHGVPTAPSSDAPFGDPDPWRTMAAAASRRTPSGRVLGSHERVAPGVVLAGFLSPPHSPGGPPRRVAPGCPADLCLLGEPVEAALARPSADQVALVLRAGKPVFQR
ncbi:amidohydrolase family protein [Streptomyces iranensis]|uniref:Amidohydrolase 3 n=1 Tax=Streptomyces iranensis TaxID=576784 RepID=A0A061ABX0_9ACTN|nr:amidohydrolase family protein [Streptomyces iranensis]MBP2063484.1 putative amidohydrolase YtcJ [Streptomyces iranensis]CDR17946.1 Amidohydrolase 3 [Streptomyces iranensis]